MTTVVVWWMVYLNASSIIVPASPNDWPDKETCMLVAADINKHISSLDRRFCVPHVRIIQPVVNSTRPVNSQRNKLT